MQVQLVVGANRLNIFALSAAASFLLKLAWECVALYCSGGLSA